MKTEKRSRTHIREGQALEVGEVAHLRRERGQPIAPQIEFAEAEKAANLRRETGQPIVIQMEIAKAEEVADFGGEGVELLVVLKLRVGERGRIWKRRTKSMVRLVSWPIAGGRKVTGLTSSWVEGERGGGNGGVKQRKEAKKEGWREGRKEGRKEEEVRDLFRLMTGNQHSDR